MEKCHQTLSLIRLIWKEFRRIFSKLLSSKGGLEDKVKNELRVHNPQTLEREACRTEAKNAIGSLVGIS